MTWQMSTVRIRPCLPFHRSQLVQIIERNILVGWEMFSDLTMGCEDADSLFSSQSRI